MVVAELKKGIPPLIPTVNPDPPLATEMGPEIWACSIK
jgi:hypothetical protein